jgi:hypothetical protein
MKEKRLKTPAMRAVLLGCAIVFLQGLAPAAYAQPETSPDAPIVFDTKDEPRFANFPSSIQESFKQCLLNHGSSVDSV